MQKYVEALPDYLMFCDIDTESIKEHIGESAKEYDTFFVPVGEGEYTEVWGIHGIVPRLDKIATRIV